MEHHGTQSKYHLEQMKKREAPPQTRAITRLDDAITKNSLPEEEKIPTEEYIEAEAEHTRKFGGRKPMFEGFDRGTPLELRRPYMLAELKRGQDAELVAAAYMMVGAHSFQGKSQWQKDREEYMKTERYKQEEQRRQIAQLQKDREMYLLKLEQQMQILKEEKSKTREVMEEIEAQE